MRHTCVEMAEGQRHHDRGGPDRMVRGRTRGWREMGTVNDGPGEEGEVDGKGALDDMSHHIMERGGR